MPIITNQFHSSKLSSDPEAPIVLGDLQNLMGDLVYMPQINSLTDFLYEFTFVLSQSAYFIKQTYADMQKITDPTIINSQAYQDMWKDLTQKTTPSLIDAANNSDPTVLANLLLQMKWSSPSQQIDLAKFESDTNTLIHLLKVS